MKEWKPPITLFLMLFHFKALLVLEQEMGMPKMH